MVVASVFFATLWTAFFAYNHLLAYYSSEFGLVPSEWAPTAYRIYEACILVIFCAFVPLFAATRRADFIGVTFVVSGTPSLVIAVSLFVTVNALTRRLNCVNVAEMMCVFASTIYIGVFHQL